jgi:uncharacterized protein (DUF58 family)
MRDVISGLTTRGRSFVAAGVAAGVCGLSLGERGLLQIGVLLIALPLLSALAASRTRYQLSSARELKPARVQVGQSTTVALRLTNATRIRTGLLLAEDKLPYPLGGHPRFIFEAIEGNGSRELTYRIRSDLRGRYTIGPLAVRVADAFGMVEISRSFTGRSKLVVTPRVVPLPQTAAAADWLGTGDRTKRIAAASGEDDVAPRAYRDGDGLRRVHWRSTARYGELMVRREEQPWHARASLFLDTRAIAHAGSGIGSSFEYAVSAAASIGVHLARQNFDTQMITDAGLIAGGGPFEEALLDMLAAARPSRAPTLAAATAALSASSGGLVIAIAGYLEPAQAHELVRACVRAQSAVALLLSTSTWDGAPWRSEGTREAARVLSDSGWRVLTAAAGTPLERVWGQLGQPSPAATAATARAAGPAPTAGPAGAPGPAPTAGPAGAPGPAPTAGPAPGGPTPAAGPAPAGEELASG